MRRSTFQQRKKTLEQRFWEKVERRGAKECWSWTSALWGNRYGFFWVGGKKRSEYAHRVSWILANGNSIPDGMEVMHSCDNHLCVNPDHLSLGTRQDNALDAVKKGRTARGEKNGGGGKLKDSDVRAIRQLRGQLSIRELAAKFGVCASTIKRIRNGRVCSHVA